MPRWLVCALLTTWLFGVWGLLSKMASGVFSPFQIQAVSTIGMIPVLIRIALSPRSREGVRPLRGAVWGFLSGLLVAAGNVPYYKALSIGGQASTVISVTALYPIVTVVLSFVILRERLHGAQWAGLVLSFAALYFLNVPDDSAWQASPWLAFALIPVLLWGVGAFFQKLSSFHASGELSTAAFLAAFVPTGVALYFVEPLQQNPSLRAWVLVILVGAAFAYGNLLFLRAFAFGGKASIVTPIAALYPAVTAPLAVALLNEKLDARSATGILITCAALVAVSIERKKAPA